MVKWTQLASEISPCRPRKAGVLSLIERSGGLFGQVLNGTSAGRDVPRPLKMMEAPKKLDTLIFSIWEDGAIFTIWETRIFADLHHLGVGITIINHPPFITINRWYKPSKMGGL